jgi:hypothetical protein
MGRTKPNLLVHLDEILRQHPVVTTQFAEASYDCRFIVAAFGRLRLAVYRVRQLERCRGRSL